MTQHAKLFAALAAPFEQHEVKTRSQQGRQLHYITCRTAANRLDNIVGPENWWDDTMPLMDGTGAFLCKLSVRLPDGQVLTKCGVGGGGKRAENDTQSGPKAAESDAFKRAASKFGVGRYLYRDGVPHYCNSAGGQARQPGEDAPEHRPQHHGQAPAGNGKPRTEWPGADDALGRGHTRQEAAAAIAGGKAIPRSGKALFGWCKDVEQASGLSVLKWLNGWAKTEGLPPRMVEWDADQVADAYAEACRKLAGVRQEPAEEAIAS